MNLLLIYHSRRGIKWPSLDVQPVIWLCLGLLIFYSAIPFWIYQLDDTAALPDAGIWVMILIALLTFLLFLVFIWNLFNKSWNSLGLPSISNLVLQFKQLTLWQQFVLYLSSFTLLLLTAIACLLAML
ncbi:hypothetical protein [Pedobacter glucosidilyticus]|uniref:hypothetical protein n=1 Tax=Pedobacter glucosidilyticus TaxID=1122941 RepID=UPI00047BCADD|nr:hypothetical protein [Pedobacter glucosidilyticus]